MNVFFLRKEFQKKKGVFWWILFFRLCLKNFPSAAAVHDSAFAPSPFIVYESILEFIYLFFKF